MHSTPKRSSWGRRMTDHGRWGRMSSTPGSWRCNVTQGVGRGKGSPNAGEARVISAATRASRPLRDTGMRPPQQTAMITRSAMHPCAIPPENIRRMSGRVTGTSAIVCVGHALTFVPSHAGAALRSGFRQRGDGLGSLVVARESGRVRAGRRVQRSAMSVKTRAEPPDLAARQYALKVSDTCRRLPGCPSSIATSHGQPSDQEGARLRDARVQPGGISSERKA